MDINEIKSEIFFLIENIKNQSHLSIDNQTKISQIEIDLIMTKIQNLYDRFCELNIKNKNLNTDVSSLVNKQIEDSGNKKQNLIDNIIAEKQRHNMEVEVKAQVEKENNFVPKEKLENSLEKAPEKEEILPQQNNNIKEESLEIEEVKNSEVIAEKENDDEFEFKNQEKQVNLFSDYKTPLADTFKVEHKSLLEKITEEIGDKSIATKLQNDKIEDLKSAIGINEKFLFINDLFNGSMQEYYNSIVKLNELENFDNGIEVFNDLKEKYSWKDDSDAFKLLYNLLERRYLYV